MPINGDIIKTVLIQELDGVQLANTLYWQVDDVGLDPSISVGLVDIMNAYFAAVTAFVSNKWQLVCGIYENQTTLEPKITVFLTQAAGGTDDSHPQDQVFRFNRWGQLGPGLPIRNGAFNQSGVEEEWSSIGRVNNMSTFDSLRNFLQDQQVMPGPNWTLDPVLRITNTPGPPPTYAFWGIIQVRLASRIFKLSKRKTSLCATG